MSGKKRVKNIKAVKLRELPLRGFKRKCSIYNALAVVLIRIRPKNVVNAVNF